MKAFVTGGAGFIGRRVVQKLIQRGYEVTALVHSQRSANLVQSFGAQPAWGDINARASMVHAMTGSDVVFHMAAWYKLGDRNWEKTERINVDGTRNVLELAYQLKIPRIVYTSTLAVYGNTHGYEPDESYIPSAGPFATEYDRTKHIAHYEVALPLIQQGAPVIIVMPGGVFGPGDTSMMGEMLTMYYRGLMPVIPGAEFTWTYAHVDDVAEGHILAAEKGAPGQSYHLAGPPLDLRQTAELWAKVLGRNPPLAYVPARFVTPTEPVVDLLSQVLPLPPLFNRDTIAILDHTYLGRSDKARRELGWSTRPLEEGFRETFAAIAATTQPVELRLPKFSRRQSAGLALGLGFSLMAAYLILRRRN